MTVEEGSQEAEKTESAETKEAATKTTSERTIEHVYYEVGNDVLAKPEALCSLLEIEGRPSTAVFCNSPSEADLVEVILRKKGIEAKKLIGHQPAGKMAQSLRQAKDGEITALVVTDVSARDLEIELLDFVVNYSIHEDPETYLLRLGAGETTGNLKKVLSLVSPIDFGNFHYAKKLLDFDFSKGDLPSDSDLGGVKIKRLIEDAKAGPHLEKAEVMDFAKEILSQEEPEKIVAFLLDQNLQAQKRAEEDGPRRGRRDRRRDNFDNGDNRRSRHNDRNDRDGDRGRGRDRDRDRNLPPPIKFVRFYIGHGSEDKFDEAALASIVKEAAPELASDELKRVNLRDHYGFVDVLEEHAQTLADSIDGAKLANGDDLVMKRATIISAPREEKPAEEVEGSEEKPAATEVASEETSSEETVEA